KNFKWQNEFDRTKHFDLDWIRLSIYNLLVEYEAGSFTADHLEDWYNIHLWSFIDRSLDDLDRVAAIHGEPCSLTSAARKNRNRVVESVLSLVRKKIGRRGDLIIQRGECEFGVGDNGRKFDRENGSKLLREHGLKLPKMLKDIFIELSQVCQYEEAKIRNLQTLGFVHSGLYMMLLLLDQPAGYICRVTRSKMEKVSEDVSQFPETLSVLTLILKAKMIIKEIICLLEGRTPETNNKFIKRLQQAGCDDVLNTKHSIPPCNTTPVKKRRHNNK
ncbi:9688_t:CDS:2, partial [Paraglomus occultum]